jgi:cobalt-zinc-cadmium efflux system outer membrane protein
MQDASCVLAVLMAGLGVAGGCAVYHPPSQALSPEATATALNTRTLHDEGLRRFLAQNLGRDPAPWPLAAWDFETLSWVGFYYNPTLDVARAQWEVARAGMKTAAARPNPVLSVIPGYNTNPGAGISPWFPAISADFLFETAGKRARRNDVARLTVESSRQAVLSAAWQVRSDLRRALIDLAFAEKRQAQLRAQSGLQQAILALLEQRLQAGAISAGETTGPRVALVRAETDLAAAERQLPLARQRVAQALGVPAEALKDLALSAPTLPSPFSADQLAAARRVSLQSRPDVLGALARYEASQAALALEVAKQYPDIHLGPGYQYDQGADKWSLALTLELPVFNHNEGPIAEAEARRQEAAAEFLAIQAQVIAEIDSAAAAQTAAAVSVGQLGRIQAELKKQQDLLQARLAAGNSDRLEVQTAGLELAAGELAVLDAQAQAAAAAGQLEDALQVPFANLDALVVPSRALTSLPPP